MTAWKDKHYHERGAMKKGLPETGAVPNDREGQFNKGVILFFLIVNA
jgi:hypothetical protein